jgi:hypothetical protein
MRLIGIIRIIGRLDSVSNMKPKIRWWGRLVISP